jgi:dolichyl-diphosphooligosaccharide--protein glycosyltransferase
MVYPEKLNWANSNSGMPISILNSGTHFNISTNDWTEAMQWLKENTPEDAVIASWWDYGYWISTLSERKTLADNATLLDWQIRKLASMFMSTPDNAWQILTSDAETDVGSYYVTLPDDIAYPTRQLDDVYGVKQKKLDEFKGWKDEIVTPNKNSPVYDEDGNITYDPDTADKYPTLYDYWVSELYVPPPILTGLDADYVLINLAVEKLSGENILDLYTLRQKGGDETKAFWFMKIADLRVLDYYNPELTGYTDKFWNETFFAKMIPFTPVLYVDPNDPMVQSETFKPGYVGIYLKDIKFPSDGQGPFQLVYISPSFERDDTGPLTGPLIYKINKEYNPNQ